MGRRAVPGHADDGVVGQEQRQYVQVGQGVERGAGEQRGASLRRRREGGRDGSTDEQVRDRIHVAILACRPRPASGPAAMFIYLREGANCPIRSARLYNARPHPFIRIKGYTQR
jgi:hypothetical protein